MTIIYNYNFAILILTIIYFYISTQNISILLSIIIIIIIGYYYNYKIKEYELSQSHNYEGKIKKLNNDIIKKTINQTSNYYLKQIPIKIKFTDKDNVLFELIHNIRFIKVFDEAKYLLILTQIEELMKIYIYILAKRYKIENHFQTFIELRTNIIKELYSIYVIIPLKLKYIYNLNPFEVIKSSINEFIKHSRHMIMVLEQFGKNEGIYYLMDTKYKPYEKNSYEVY